MKIIIPLDDDDFEGLEKLKQILDDAGFDHVEEVDE